MSEIVSTIKPEGPDFEEHPIVDQKKYWTSIEQLKKACKDCREI